MYHALVNAIGTLAKRISNLEVREQWPVTPTVADASANLTLTTSDQTIPGVSLGVGAGVWHVEGIFSVLTGNDDLDNNQIARGVLYVSGVAQTPETIATLHRIGGVTRLRSIMKQTWIINAPVDVSTTLSLNARKDGGTGTSVIAANQTRMVVTQLAQYGL